MRTFFLILLIGPAFAFAQATPDQAGVAQAFGNFISAVNHGEFTDVAELVACPLENDAGEEEIADCNTELAEHLIRVERIKQLAQYYFPSEPTALNPHYAAENEGDEEFHLLLFSDLDPVPFVLVAFSDAGGSYKLTNLDSEEEPNHLLPPHSLTSALVALIQDAGSDAVSNPAFAGRVVARGGDPEREWKAVANPEDENEMRFVQSARDQINEFISSQGLEDSQLANLRYESERESEGTWHVLTTSFPRDGGDSIDVAFAFLAIGDSILLGDID